MSICNIAVLQEFAINKKGKLLSTEYVNAHEKLLWQCNHEHQWLANWNNIKSGQWCPYCAGRNYSREQLLTFCIDYAASKSGYCLSTVYISNNTRMLWKCKENHIWEARWSSIKVGKWCPTCAKQSKPDISECCDFAKNKNGICLEISYVNAHHRMLWECSEKHQWKASWDGIKRGNWCPECASFKTEHKCKELLEQKLGFELKKTRFYYDVISRHKFYEFDGYNEKHKIAFEYHGYQHYIYPNRFHKTKEIYEKAKQRDLDKLQYAKENNIKLIIISYIEEKHLESYINSI